MKKLISLFTVAAFLSFSGLVTAGAQEVNQEVKKETKEVKKTERKHKAVKVAKKSCETCPEKSACSPEKKADEKKAEKK